MFRSRVYTTLIHTASWLLFCSLPVVFSSRILSDKDFFSFLFSSSYWLFCLSYLLVFYITSYLLIPHLYLRKKYISFCLSVLALFAAIFFLRPFDHFMLETRRFQIRRIVRPELLPPLPDRGLDSNSNKAVKKENHLYLSGHGTSRILVISENGAKPLFQNRFFLRIDLISIYLFFTVIALSMAIEITRRWRLSEQRAVRAEADKANAELSFLKAQINPHFIYNTLNNLYSLAVTKNENTAESIIKLSNIMRYVTDDAGEDFVSLEEETAFITDYIDLQRLRLGMNTPITFEVSGNLENKTIAPLILITFIENVFKYGVSKHEPSPVVIKIHADEKAVTFFSQNRIFDTDYKMKRAGIGITNTKQRLEHLYPNKHALDINRENNHYTVMLTLQL